MLVSMCLHRDDRDVTSLHRPTCWAGSVGLAGRQFPALSQTLMRHLSEVAKVDGVQFVSGSASRVLSKDGSTWLTLRPRPFAK
jgi:hypothetical protein